MIYDTYIALSGFFAQGGDVLYLIALTTFLMWMLIIERTWYFASEHKQVVREVTGIWESRSERRIVGSREAPGPPRTSGCQLVVTPVRLEPMRRRGS